MEGRRCFLSPGFTLSTVSTSPKRPVATLRFTKIFAYFRKKKSFRTGKVNRWSRSARAKMPFRHGALTFAFLDDKYVAFL
jgi:hypothetical protein